MQIVVHFVRMAKPKIRHLKRDKCNKTAEEEMNALKMSEKENDLLIGFCRNISKNQMTFHVFTVILTTDKFYVHYEKIRKLISVDFRSNGSHMYT